MYDAEDFFDLLNSHDQELCLKIMLTFGNNTPQDKAEEPEPQI